MGAAASVRACSQRRTEARTVVMAMGVVKWKEKRRRPREEVPVVRARRPPF